MVGFFEGINIGNYLMSQLHRKKNTQLIPILRESSTEESQSFTE